MWGLLSVLRKPSRKYVTWRLVNFKLMLQWFCIHDRNAALHWLILFMNWYNVADWLCTRFVICPLYRFANWGVCVLFGWIYCREMVQVYINPFCVKQLGNLCNVVESVSVFMYVCDKIGIQIKCEAAVIARSRFGWARCLECCNLLCWEYEGSGNKECCFRN